MSTAARRIVYPESDGLPSAENTPHFDWIALLKWNLKALFQMRRDVFVAADNFIYPVEGDTTTRTAPRTFTSLSAGPRVHAAVTASGWRGTSSLK